MNRSFPATDRVSLDLGTTLAGQTVRLRFRIATDGGVSAPGWTIDNLTVQGIENHPFTSVVPHTGPCTPPPVISAVPPARTE